mmetsp:Transcript_14346/g.36427  ORF Transcript_14346/g.36427 Transcript_14346/m.36427 type:complete len:577 (+) Transcript_14346:3-1733(+)
MDAATVDQETIGQQHGETVSLSIELDELPHADDKARLLDELGLGTEHALPVDADQVPDGLRDALAIVSLTEHELYGVLCDLAEVRSCGARATSSNPTLQVRALPAVRLPVGKRNERAVHVQIHKRLPETAVRMRASAAAARHAFMRPPTTASKADPCGPKLSNFIAAHLPADSRTVELRIYKDTGRGLGTTRSLAEGDVALRIPSGLLLTAPRLRARLRGTSVEAELQDVDDDTALALALLAACAEPVSAWTTYEALMPTAAEMPHYSSWGEAELEALDGTALADEARAAMAALHETFKIIVPRVAGKLFEGGGLISFERFRWAAAAVATRALLVDFGDGEGKVGTLVPVADMLNHHVRAPLASAHFDFESDSLIFSAAAAVPAGSQLRLFYGPLPGAELLLQYGFLDTDALDAEAVRFDVEPPDSEDESEMLKKAVLLACGRYTASHFVTIARPCSTRLLGALRLCLLDAEGLEGLVASGVDLEAGPINAVNESMVWSVLAQLLQQMRDNLPGGSADEDEALILKDSTLSTDLNPAAKLSYTLSIILKWRICQKRALDLAVDCSRRGEAAAVASF